MYCGIVCLQVSLDLKKQIKDGSSVDFIKVKVMNIAIELTERTWDRKGTLKMESISITDHQSKGVWTLCLLIT